MTKHRWCFAIAAGLVLASLHVAWAEPVVETLDNGCRLVVEVDRSRPVAAFRVYIGTGSIYEGPYLGGGISHFLEHTISEGSRSRTLDEIEAELNALGNAYNAYTTKDHTCYFATVASEDISRAIDVISEFVLFPTFPEEHVETQRGIIQREMAMGDDDPGRVIHHLLSETLFTTHPERYRIIGYPERFNELTRDDIVDYHRTTYVPDNMVVVAVGDFDGDAVLGQLRAIFGEATRRPQPAHELVSEPTQIAPRRRVEVDANLQRAYLRIAWPTVSIFNPDLYALDTLSSYLTGGESALLVRRLRDELGLVDGISSYSATPRHDAGYFAFGATLDPANLERVEEEIVAALDQVARRAPDRREIERVRRQVEAAEIFAQESAEGRASMLGSNLLIANDVDFGTRYLEGIRKVTPEQVRDVARRYFVPERMNVALLTPPTATEAVRADRTRTREARTHQRTLENGLTVVVRENHSVPAVSISTATLGGLRYETAENAGITALMAEMLVRGSQHHTRNELAERVDRLGGSLVPFSGRNSFGLNAHFMAGDLPAALELTLDALFRPTFPAEELERQRQLTLAAIERQGDDVQAFAFRELLSDLFTRHPYRFLPIGTAESVAALTAEDLRSFHQAWTRPSATAVVIAGDVDPAEAFAQVERLTKGIATDAPEPAPAPTEPPVAEPRERIIERPQQQAIVAYGFHGLAVNDPERDVLDVLDAVISGSGMPGGRLHERLRGQQLVYFVHGSPILGLDPGAYVIYAGTAPETADTVREEIEAIVAAIATAPPTAEEMGLAKRAASISNLSGLETNSSLAQTIALDVIYGLGAENWESYDERLDAVTAEQVQALAQRLLDLERSVVVVTTPGG